jgi:hypothetical protein
MTQRVREAIDKHVSEEAPRLARLWAYYRNPMRPDSTPRAIGASGTGSQRPYRLAQEWGLPTRITGDFGASEPARHEVVIENDIGWRIDAMVDFLFGRPVVLNSTAPDPTRRGLLTSVLRRILARHGGLGLLQQMAVLGAVYGHVDVLVKLEPRASAEPASVPLVPGAPDGDFGSETVDNSRLPTAEVAALVERLAGRVRIEVVDPARGVPILADHDHRVVEAFAQAFRLPRRDVTAPDVNARVDTTWLRRLLGASATSPRDPARVGVVELLTPDRWAGFHDDRLVATGRNDLGRIPLVHIQNVALPFAYAGAGDVEPLVPLQDELNTRLSDRAHRITLQSFRMYLGKGIDNFLDQPVGPGRMWMTDNPEASVIEFGGDSSSPSEDAHVREVREAMDKTSGVSPIAAGAIKGRIGRLTSAAALRVTLLALLARTERKRATYGAGLASICELSLAWLDRAGLLPTTPGERAIELHWPSPIPLNESERLDEARAKLAVGVPQAVVVRELGY